jgi:nucleotide-binding universal stress UspA family protein
MLSKILVCVDGSACSLIAARSAALIARHCSSEVVVVTVFHPSIGSNEAATWPVDIEPARIADCARNEKEIVELQIAPIFSDLNPSYRLLQEIGDPTDAILSVAERETPDLIVVGSRGLRGVKELLLGSVSCAIMHGAACPVLIVRGDHAGSGRRFEKILLASDGSETANRVAHTAVELAQAFATSLTVLNISTDLWANLRPGEAEALHEEEALMGSQVPGLDADRTLDGLRQIVSPIAREAGVYCAYIQKPGEPHVNIVKYASLSGTDLIVIGSRGLGAVGEMLFGSVSNYVAHHATCPVLVVR